jgi:hypothetical protein
MRLWRDGEEQVKPQLTEAEKEYLKKYFRALSSEIDYLDVYIGKAKNPIRVPFQYERIQKPPD